MKNHPKIMIMAGEASGDMHGANLVNELKQTHPDIMLRGMGGNLMRQAGVDLIADLTHFSVCGFIEILGYLPKFYSLYKMVKKELIKDPPDLLILIDYPTFNLRLAKVAAKHNIKVLYYISPQIWAWHTSRIKKIKHSVNMMAVIFPFESDFYRQHSVPVKYVGHPLAGKVTTSAASEHLRQNFGIEKDTQVVGLLPGSRKNEIKYILPTLLQTAALLQQSKPDIKFILPLADTLTEEELAPYLQKVSTHITIIKENRYDAMSICDVVVAASGTVTLELALLGVPTVLVYKANYLSARIAKAVLKIPRVGLCNIVAGKEIVKELLQEQAVPENIQEELLRLLVDSKYKELQKNQLASVAEKLTAQKECQLSELVLQVLNNA
jgi:lipid-A-disaccharide synthase